MSQYFTMDIGLLVFNLLVVVFGMGRLWAGQRNIADDMAAIKERDAKQEKELQAHGDHIARLADDVKFVKDRQQAADAGLVDLCNTYAKDKGGCRERQTGVERRFDALTAAQSELFARMDNVNDKLSALLAEEQTTRALLQQLINERRKDNG